MVMFLISVKTVLFPTVLAFEHRQHINSRKLRKNLLIFSSFTLGPFKTKLKGKGTCGCGRKEHMASALAENLNTGQSIGTRRLTSINMLSELFWQNTKWGTLAQHCSQECCSVSLPTYIHPGPCYQCCYRKARIQTRWRISVYQISSQRSSHKQWSC